MLKDIIRDLCRTRNMSITKLEEELGLSNGAIGKWDKVSPKADSIEKVANYFAVSVDYLLGRESYLEMLTNQGKDNIEKNNPYTNEMLELFKRLQEDDQKAILELAKHMANKE